MVEQVLSKARHYLMRFHRPAKLKLERWHGFLIKQHASPLGGVFFIFQDKRGERNGRGQSKARQARKT